MATAIRPIGHEDRLSLVEHLDELRTRLILCLFALAIAFGLCFWQNEALLDVVNDPLRERTESAAKRPKGPIGESARFNLAVKDALERNSAAFDRLARNERLPTADRAALAQAAQANRDALKSAPRETQGRQPVTLGISEPFTATVTVAFYFAVLLAFPLILWQLYGFVLPAFNARERRVALPLMAMVPFLFVGGVLFGYFLVLPAAISFLQNFNSAEFDILVQAKAYYSFAAITLLMLGILFQIPVAVLALTRLGIVTSAQLRRNSRYALLLIAIIAAILPGVDPITMLILMVPMIALYGLSILLASWVERLQRRAAGREALALDDSDA
jgi:sec-independent protein translocase protein TatC